MASTALPINDNSARRPTLVKAVSGAPEHRSPAPARARTGNGAALLPSADILEQRIAEELALVERQLEYLMSVLLQEPAFRLRYSSFQSAIEAMRRNVGEIGRILGSEDKDAAVDRLAGPELKGRLRRTAIISILD
jgi:hypothetical protein